MDDNHEGIRGRVVSATDVIVEQVKNEVKEIRMNEMEELRKDIQALRDEVLRLQGMVLAVKGKQPVRMEQPDQLPPWPRPYTSPSTEPMRPPWDLTC